MPPRHDVLDNLRAAVRSVRGWWLVLVLVGLGTMLASALAQDSLRIGLLVTGAVLLFPLRFRM